jgi:exosortase B
MNTNQLVVEHRSDRTIMVAAPWMLVGLGLALLFVPTYLTLFDTVWAEDEQMHGPIILAVSSWLMYRSWPSIMALEPRPAWLAGTTTLLMGLFAYMVGRSQAIIQLEVGSQIVLLAAILLLLVGAAGLRRLWFPLFFMLFMVPLPGVFVQALTIPLKMGVSYVAENVLYWAGYPIARTGVILQVGQYQLLVADACAGMHTMFTLEALGLFYMNLMGHVSVLRNSLLALLIIPISITANIVRVLVLVLVTYHLGNDAGQGFLHGFAGMVLFITALLLILAVDSVLGRFIGERHGKSA